MELKELVEHKKGMEAEIRASVAAAINRFREATGMSPMYVEIDLIEQQQLGEGEPLHIVEVVRSEIRTNGVTVA